MLRKLALSLAVSAALGASQVNALGLGEIQVNSALNEPLDAEITLTQVRDLSPLQIQPRMASLDEYSTASGGSQARYLRDIQFQVLVSPEGNGRIRLKSSEPVQEPFLNFMVEVNWPSGRLVREYTLLLDPPVFEPTPVGRPLSATSAQTRTFASGNTLPRPQQASVDNIRTRANRETQVYVGTNDTLWEISKKVKSAGATEHQVMLALLRKNPQAFPSGNINNLKAGVVLDIPTDEDVQRLSHREAVAEVARQMQLWRDGRASASTDNKAPMTVSKPAESVSASSEQAADPMPAPGGEPEEGQLTVVAPAEDEPEVADSKVVSSIDSDKESNTDTGADEQVVSAAAERLENEVLLAQEKIDRLERDNTDLNDKLSSVLEQLESQSRLLELQSQQMSTLQEELSRQGAMSAPVPVAEEANTEGSVLQNPAVLGGIGAGALALLGALLFALRRKRGESSERKRELLNVPDDLRDEQQVDDSDAPLNIAAAAAGGAAAAVAVDSITDDNDQDGKSLDAASAEGGDFVRPPMSALAPEEADDLSELDQDLQELDQDLQELDLDMDLDLDDLDMQASDTDDVDDVATIDAAEFDLGNDEDEEQLSKAPGATDQQPDETVIDTADEGEDDGLEFAVEPTAQQDSPSELDAMLADDEMADDLDFLLNDSVESDVEEVAAQDDELPGDLEFPGVLSTESAEDELQADDEAVIDNSLHETVEAAPELDFEVDPELEAMLQGAADLDDAADAGVGFAETDDNADNLSADDDLDSLLASFDPEDDVNSPTGIGPLSGEDAEEELTANISHDLEMDLDSEVDELLGGTDDEIELDEQDNTEQDDVLDKMNLLSDADEIETKLDLARAYIEMEDTEGASDILHEITSEGSEEQRAEARKLLDTLG